MKVRPENELSVLQSFVTSDAQHHIARFDERGGPVAGEREHHDGDLLEWLRVFCNLATIIVAETKAGRQASYRRMAEQSSTEGSSKYYSTFSSQIKKLEHALPRSPQGEIVELIGRTNKGCSLTPAGDRLLPLVDEMLRQFDKIRTGHYIPPKSLLRIGAPNQFCLHLLPGIIQRFAESEKRAVGDDGNSMSTPVTDITVLEPRELMDGLRLLHHDYIDILLEGCVGPLQVPFSTVDRPPLLLRNVVLMHKRFLEKLDPAGCHSDYIVPADLARLPVISAITPMLTAAFDSPSLSRIQVPTSEAVRRLAEQGHGAGILINLRSLLGVPPNAATYEEVRAYFSQRDLALRWFPICDEEKPSFFKMEQVILVTRESAHPSSLIKRFKNAVADECKEISQNGLVLPKASIS